MGRRVYACVWPSACARVCAGAGLSRAQIFLPFVCVFVGLSVLLCSSVCHCASVLAVYVGVLGGGDGGWYGYVSLMGSLLWCLCPTLRP